MKYLFRSAFIAGLLLAASVNAVSAAPAAMPVPTLTRVTYVSFLSHLSSYTDRISADLDDWNFASDWDDDAGMAAADLSERNHARAEYRWINARTPSRTCFKALWASHKLEVHYDDLASNYGYQFHLTGNLTAGSNAVYWLGKANKELDHETAILKKTRC